MSHYNAGRTFEWKVRDALREDGYEVLRSAGSKTKIDLVAMKPGQIVFVQCKVNGLCAPAERSRLRDLAGMVGALPIVAYNHKEGRSAAVVRYRLLTGDGPKAFASWTPDQVEMELLGEADVPARRLSTLLDSASPVRVGSSDPVPCHFEAR
jgi:Holliday junction resolvase